jgi:hypothetical protein
VFRANLSAFAGFQPSFFDGDVTLFRTRQGSQLDRGQDYVRGSLGRWCVHVEVHEAPGSHMTLMLDPSVSSEFAKCFGASLNLASETGVDR